MRSFLTATVLFFIASITLAATASVPEGNSGLTVRFATITRTPIPGQGNNFPYTGTYRTVDGTATAADNDYVPIPPTDYVIPPGQDSIQIEVDVRGDLKVEADETFTLEVTNVNDPTLLITIINDDVPTVTVSDVRVTEGAAGTTTPMTFTVTMTSPTALAIQAPFAFSDGTATVGQDYQATNGTLVFVPSQVPQSFTVSATALGDGAFEPDETFTLVVTPAGGSPATGTGTIGNDDVAPLARVVIISGNGQRGRLSVPLAQPLVVEVQNSLGAPVAGIVVQWKVTKGTAQLGSSTSTTNAQGRASTTVTLNSVGAVDVEASAAQLAPVTFTLASETAFASRATGPVAVPIAGVLDQICARNEVTFDGACRALSILGDGQLTTTLEHVAPQQSGAESKVASAAVGFVATGIGARLAALRSGERFSINKLSLSISGTPVPIGMLATSLMQQAPAAAEEPVYNGWSGFLSGNIGSGERIGRNGQLGFDLKSSGLMAGIDRQFGDAVIGVSVNAMQLESKLNDDVGKLDTTGYAVSLYGSRAGLFASTTGRKFDGMHIDGSLTIGRNSYEAEHIVDIPTLPLSVARSENDASVFALTLGTGVDAHSGRTDYDLSLSGTWSRADIDDLTESGNGPLILFVKGHEIESAVATAGFNVRTAIPTSFGNLLPMFRAEMVHEFKSGARLVTARFLRDTLNTAFTIPLDQPDPNYGKLSAGLQAVFPRGLSAFVEVTQDVLRSDLHFRTIQVNVSKSF